MQIKSPDSTYSGTSTYGATVLTFDQGVAQFDGELPPGVRQYLKGAGYGIDEPPAEAPTASEQLDPRDLVGVSIGTPLRDAAVDPDDGDFLPPVNAGQANPHGPDVVAPGIHALETKAVLPGDVADTDRQQARESELAERTLAGDEPVPDVVASLSDGVVDSLSDTRDAAEQEPAGNASRVDWAAYRIAQGMDPAEAEGMTRDELRDYRS